RHPAGNPQAYNKRNRRASRLRPRESGPRSTCLVGRGDVEDRVCRVAIPRYRTAAVDMEETYADIARGKEIVSGVNLQRAERREDATIAADLYASGTNPVYHVAERRINHKDKRRARRRKNVQVQSEPVQERPLTRWAPIKDIIATISSGVDDPACRVGEDDERLIRHPDRLYDGNIDLA